jgi:hypothetical protein
MYIPPVIIPGRKNNCCNTTPCCESLIPIYPRRRRRYGRRYSPDYDIAEIMNKIQPPRNIQIPPLPPPPPRPPRQFYKPIIQQMDPMVEFELERCRCKLEKCQCKRQNCECQLDDCQCNLLNSGYQLQYSQNKRQNCECQLEECRCREYQEYY